MSFITSVLLPPPSVSHLHLWPAADEDTTSRRLMNNAGVMKRQTLCVRKVKCLLCFEGVFISGRAHVSHSTIIATEQGKEVTHAAGMSARVTSHPPA